MIFCSQKPNHCFVACCASLLGKADIAAQESIVAQFPKELRKGTAGEGVPEKDTDTKTVVEGLGLSKDAKHVGTSAGNYFELSELLKKNKGFGEKILIFTTSPTNHCIAIKEIHDDKLIVMDPENKKKNFSELTFAEFEAYKPTLFIL